MDTIGLLDAAAKKLGSDSAVARHLGISRQAISNVRNKHYHLSDYHSARLAEAAGVHWQAFIALKAEKTENSAEGRYWLGKWQQLRKVVTVAIMMTFGALVSGKNYASMDGIVRQSASEYTMRT